MQRGLFFIITDRFFKLFNRFIELSLFQFELGEKEVVISERIRGRGLLLRLHLNGLA